MGDGELCMWCRSIVQSIWRHAIMQVPLLIPKGPCRVELYPIWDSSIFCKSFSTLEWRGAAIVPCASNWSAPLATSAICSIVADRLQSNIATLSQYIGMHYDYLHIPKTVYFASMLPSLIARMSFYCLWYIASLYVIYHACSMSCLMFYACAQTVSWNDGTVLEPSGWLHPAGDSSSTLQYDSGWNSDTGSGWLWCGTETSREKGTWEEWRDHCSG